MLFPRTVVERVKRNGVFVYDTVKRVPLKRGLDLQGGMHLDARDRRVEAGWSPTSPKRSTARSSVVRQRIDEFGVAEPVVQKVGDDRIIVELPGIDDPERAQDVVAEVGVPRVPDRRQDAGAGESDRRGSTKSRAPQASDSGTVALGDTASRSQHDWRLVRWLTCCSRQCQRRLGSG